MGTSKSSEQAAEYLAGVSIFSGRPDPTWPVSQSAAKQLLALWDSLAASPTAQQQPPPLGYRGCFLKDMTNKREWVAYKGVVMLKAFEGDEARSDENRKFESMLIGSAPKDLIPPQILESEGL